MTVLRGLVTVVLFASAAALAEDKITLETTVVSGNQDLPRVLYVLPWRSEEGAPVSPAELAVRAGTTPGPVRPVELRRRLKLLAPAPRLSQATNSSQQEK